MNSRFAIMLGSIALVMFAASAFAQPVDGDNQYRLAEVNPRFLGTDTLDSGAGRGVWVADNPDLDNDGKPELIVTEYSDGGRVFVFEMVGNDALEFVWASPVQSVFTKSSPRSVTVGDFDNNGRQEIIFPVGYFSSFDIPARGIYFYEWTGQDNDYGVKPTYQLSYMAIDSAFATANVGRTENGLIVRDIDGDDKSELVFPPASGGGNLDVANLYILEVESGTLADSNVVINNEFVYDGFTTTDPPYSPRGAAIGDVDSDGLDEIIVSGWGSGASGTGIGFVQIDGPDLYTPGNVVPLSDGDYFWVKSNPVFTIANGEPVVYVHGSDNGTPLGSKFWVLSGIVSDQFAGPDNVAELWPDVGFWGVMGLGDQDHPTNSAGDGFDLYMYGGGGTLLDIEYDGTGGVTDTNSYAVKQIFDLETQYDAISGLFNDIYTYPGMDLDNDGLRDMVASYKGSSLDTLNGELFTSNTFNIFFFEWGDSTASLDVVTSVPQQKKLTIITPDDYQLEQNYPNPFNPETEIRFTLPISKPISLKIFNARGQEVRTLVNNQTYTQGLHSVQWDARDNAGRPLASGVYIYRLTFGNFSKSKQMTLVR